MRAEDGGEGGSVTPEAVALETELVTVVRLLEVMNRIDRVVYAALDHASYRVARVLHLMGPLSIQDLAAQLWLEPTTMTRNVASMEQRGLVTRSDMPSDKRVSLVRLSGEGLSRMRQTQRARCERLGEIMSSWSLADIEDFSRLLERFNQSQVEHAAERFNRPPTADI